MNTVNLLANLFTFSSLFFGFISIIFSLEAHFTFASWAIILSVILDGLDGQIARENPIPSEFGKELDSLADVVSFGIAPSILGYIFIYRHFHFWATCALFIYLVCSITRLAKYNITPKEELNNCFYGLPTTISGGLISSFILIYRRSTQLPPPVAFLILVILLSLLMISRVRYPNLNTIKITLCKSRFLPAATILTIIFSIVIPYFTNRAFLPEATIFLLFIFYLVFFPFLLGKFV